MNHIVILSLAAAASGHAALVIDLPGNSEQATWEDLTSVNPYWANNGYPTACPGAAAWPAPVAANRAGSEGSALLMKASGNGYCA